MTKNSDCGGKNKAYSYYRIPKALTKGHCYRGLSSDAKYLYGLLLDRMNLSVQNGWKDKENRVYIYFKLEETMEQLQCGHTKAGKLFKELERLDLIERKRQGLGKPARIYVKAVAYSQTHIQTSQERSCAPSKQQMDNSAPAPKHPSVSFQARRSSEQKHTVMACASVPEDCYTQPMPEDSVPDLVPEDFCTQPMSDYAVSDSIPEDYCAQPMQVYAVSDSTTEKNWEQFAPARSCASDMPAPSQPLQEIQTSQIEQSGLPESGCPDFHFSEVLYKKNKTEKNNTKYPISSYQSLNYSSAHFEKRMIRIDEIDLYRARIQENIEYDRLLEDDPLSRTILDSYVELMSEACVSRWGHIRISGNYLPTSVVRSRFLKLNREHITYVLDCMKENTTLIRNIKAYTLAALYNAPMTMHTYYAARVNHDLYGNAS